MPYRPPLLEPLCNPKSLPPNFSEQLATLANSGHRVVALAGKTLQANFLKVQKITREEAEKELTFLGFLVMQNTLKPESAGVIRELRAASLRCLMVTGDNLLTAVSVARYRMRVVSMIIGALLPIQQQLLFQGMWIGEGRGTGGDNVSHQGGGRLPEVAL